jgi:hypothetical protein
MANVRLLNAATATNSAPVEFCTGTITTVTVANLVDGEIVTINGRDAAGQPWQYIFEIDKTGDGVTSGRTQVNVSAIASADEVRDALVSAINLTAIPVTAASGGSGSVALTADVAGPECNFWMSETVANGTFAVAVTNATEGASLKDFHDDEDAAIVAYSTAGSSTMTVTLKLWLFDGIARRWYPAGTNATAASKGLLNEGNAIGETGTDKIRHTEAVGNIRHFIRAYLEITAIGGTDTAISAYLVGWRGAV